MDTTRFLLVRHGQTAWTVARRLQGQTDIPLDELGRRQAEALRPIVQEFAPDRVLASPARRATETAQILSGLRTTFDERLKEANLGSWEGLTPDEIGPVYSQWRAGHFDPPGAEPRVELVERVAAALQDESVPAGNVLVVTHGGVIRAALDALIGLKTENIVPVSPASLTVVEVTAGDLVQAKLQHYNLSPSSKNIQLQPEAR